MPSKTIQLTNNGPAITTSSFLQLQNDSPAKQCPVPHDGPAHFKQLSVPMTTASTGLRTDNDRHSSLNDITAPQAFPAMTATMTATMTQVPALTTAITKATLKLVECFLHPAKSSTSNATIHDPSLLLPLCQDNSAIMTTTHKNLLLLSVQDDSAIIMMATHTSYSLQLIVTFIKPNTDIPLPDLEEVQHAQINL
jgi:hypothetical protein